MRRKPTRLREGPRPGFTTDAAIARYVAMHAQDELFWLESVAQEMLRGSGIDYARSGAASGVWSSAMQATRRDPRACPGWRTPDLRR